ncbi:hypothetical protein [Mesorhizobium tamadayense]|uniref:hypothetical protein n=1 Tax=Mesorhizobium tamadayense TaxID=425306 RepID=UPI00142DAC87|nr:hypothetical protein [Mesorhizobium tamadayense]
MSAMKDSPEKRNEWRAIFYVQARVAILFVPIIVSLLIIGALAGRDPDAIDRTVTSSVK